MVILNWRLAFFVLALTLAIFGIILAYLGPKCIAASDTKVIRSERDRLKTTYLIETLYGMRAVKSLGLRRPAPAGLG